MAFPTGWGRKQEITVDNTKVSGSGSHTDFIFPVTLDHLDAEVVNGGGNSALTNGDDIRFTTDVDGTTEIPFHIAAFVADATEGNRKCAIFVKVPSLSTSADTSIWIWYRNASASPYAVTDTYGRNAVWAQYEAVILGNEASGTLYDATGNGYDATLTSGTQTATATNHPLAGLTWIDFDGSSWYTLASSQGMLDGSASMFLSAWHYGDNNFSWQGLIGNRNNTPSDSNWFHLYHKPLVQARISGTVDEIAGSPAYGSSELHFTAGQHTGTALYIYGDGALIGTDSTIFVPSGITGVADYRLGTYYSAAARYNGRAGLWKAGLGTYSADWLLTEYNSVNSPSTFASAGTPEDVVANNPATGSVVITGTTTQGETLTATDTIADADGLGTFIYTWYRDDVLISGANASTYVLTAFDVNTTIKARIDFTDGGGAAEYKVSAGVGPVAAASAATYQECYFVTTINAAFVAGASPLTNFCAEILTADFAPAFLDGGSQSATNGGGNIRIYTSSTFEDVNRLAMRVDDFDINAGTAAIKFVIPTLSPSVDTPIYIVKINPDATQPAANDTYGSDNVDLYDPDLVPPADPSDLKTTYDNMDAEADFMTSSGLTCSLIGAANRYRNRRSFGARRSVA